MSSSMFMGSGIMCSIPLSSYDKLPAVGAPIKILTHLAIREDAHVLYGFMSHAERDLFRLLVTHVSGIGPKTALDVLSGTTVTNFKAAVVAGDAALLAKTKGIGKKTAERIIVELKDKVGIAAAWEAASAAHAPTPEEAKVNDAVLALIALGYKQVDAHKAVKQAQEKGGASADDRRPRAAGAEDSDLIICRWLHETRPQTRASARMPCSLDSSSVCCLERTTHGFGRNAEFRSENVLAAPGDGVRLSF